MEARFEAGNQLRTQNREPEALALFQQLLQETGSERARAQVGLVEQALGRLVDAEGHLVQALASSDPWVSARRELLQQALAQLRLRLGNLEITGGPSGADVVINGASVARLPLRAPLRVTTGTVVLELRQPGFYPVRREVLIRAEAPARESGEMNPERREEPSRPPASEAGTAATRGPSGPIDTRTVGPSLAPGGAVLGVGLAAALVGGVVFAVGNGSPSGCTRSGLDVMCPPSADLTAAQQSVTLGNAGVGLLAAGGGVSVLGAIWLAASASQRRTVPAVSATSDGSRWQLVIGGHF